VGEPEKMNHLENSDVDGKIILRWIFRKRDVGAWAGAGSGLGQLAGTYECGNETSGSIKFGEFLEKLKTGLFLKEDCAAWSK